MNRKSTTGATRTTRSRKTEHPPDSTTFHAADEPQTSAHCSGFQTADTTDEEIPLPELTHERSLTSSEANAALRDLFNHSTNNEGAYVDEDDALVPGFRKGVRLMPHQIQGRAWMRDREDLTKKRAGGILADDMGLGKTIMMTARIVDGPLSKKDRDAGWRKATLVVCPLALVQQWAAEIEKFTLGLNVLQYHGPARRKGASLLPDADVVLTTYGIVCSEHAQINPDDFDASSSVLFSTKWGRIVLDEAHTIKNRATKTAVACFDLRAKFRWCLTGTPMQNKVDEFYPLMRFLRIKPLNDWERFNSQIAKPISKGPGSNLAMKRLQVVLQHVMLRRTKEEIEKYLPLPARSVHLLPCQFDPAEREFYIALKTQVQTLLRRILTKGDTGGQVYMNILVLLLRLRQACDHPCLVLEDYAGDDVADYDMSDAEEPDGKPRCRVCMTRLTSRNSAAKAWPGHCVNCAALKVQAQNLRGPMRASAKIRVIIQLLKHIEHESGGQEKTVIFSQFTSMLDVIEPFLAAIGVGFVRYDGSMSPKERKQALEEIATDPRKTVILVSLKAGGVGLNLTSCNHVILVDMWWNPAVEEQAFDRTHRVGQTRDVHIYKLKIDGTVEDRILELQAKKRELTKMALSGDQIKNSKLGMNELLALFE
ncbi:SNF2 family N-terminal domain-containing protein [Mycena belliarum]|uniref:SNF2 family N-terminal domain-containing protein n=1 Tax=Mycena belliarum TaxID=1033014 RepID=A0AAD6XH70_9AGAR|nr:SNF2 family N-terminal domain-containing protein [Mycena belliae]